MVIWKFPLKHADEQVLRLRIGAKVLSVGLDPQGVLSMWVMLDPGDFACERRVRIIGTGNPMPDMTGFRFVGTVCEHSFVWHIFVEAE